MARVLSGGTLQICMICFLASGCAAGNSPIGSEEPGNAKLSNEEVIVDQDVEEAMVAHGVAPVHVRVVPPKLLGHEGIYTPEELAAAFANLFTGVEWEQVGMLENQPEFLGYLTQEGLEVLRKSGVAEFVSRGDRVDDVMTIFRH